MSRRIIITVSCGMAFFAAIWFTQSRYEGALNDNNPTAIGQDSIGEYALDQNRESEREPHFHLPDSGRITIEQSALPEGDEVIVALPVAADSIGDTPLPTRVVSVDGRVIDVVATQASDNQPSVTVSLDPKWLTQGSYMIQLETREKSALALRRYVLIIN